MDDVACEFFVEKNPPPRHVIPGFLCSHFCFGFFVFCFGLHSMEDCSASFLWEGRIPAHFPPKTPPSYACFTCSQCNPFFLVTCIGCQKQWCCGLVNHYRNPVCHPCDMSVVTFSWVLNPYFEFTLDEMAIRTRPYSNPKSVEAAVKLAEFHSKDPFRDDNVAMKMRAMFPTRFQALFDKSERDKGWLNTPLQQQTEIIAKLPNEEWLLVSSYNNDTKTYEVNSSQHQSFIGKHIPTGTVRYEYKTELGTYTIHIKNIKKMGGENTNFGFSKGLYSETWSTTLDWGTQNDLCGAKFDSSHRAADGKGNNHWRHSCLTNERCTLKAANGNKYRAQRNTPYLRNATYPRGCYGGGLVQTKEEVISTGCMQGHHFAEVGPEGERGGAYVATMLGVKAVRIWMLIERD